VAFYREGRTLSPSLTQNAEKFRQPVSFIWSVWSVLFIWLNQTSQIDQMNQINQMNPAACV
jgi:hypothetical protein